MLPESLKPKEYGVSVAELIIDGLAICCFNKTNEQERFWEIAFLREENHDLIIRVRKLNADGRVLKSSDPYPVPMESKLITISADTPSTSHYSDFGKGYYFEQPSFSRKGDDSYDFRWVIDFVGPEVPHGQFGKLIKKSDDPKRTPVTIVKIPCSLLYTSRVTEDCVILSDNPNSSVDGHVLGRTNAEIGGIIFAHNEDGQINFVDTDGLLKIPSRDYDTVISYEISITNMDTGKDAAILERENRNKGAVRRQLDPTGIYVPGDFHHYYNVIDVKGKQQTLFAPSRKLIRARDGDCHAVAASLDTLMPLIDG